MKFSYRLLSGMRVSALVCSMLFSLAQAQTNQLGEVFVSASRMSQPMDSVLNEVNVLNKDDLQTMGHSNLSQALGKLPGVQSTSYGTHSVYIRGTESRMTPLYIEGIRIESQDGLRLGGGVPWEMIPLSMVDRVEVVKGPTSTIYGSDAMGGVVQLFGRRGTVEDRPQISQSFASMGSMQTAGQISGKRDALDYSLQLSSFSSDGYNTRPDLTHSPSKEAKANDFGIVKLGFDITNEHRIEWVGLKSKQFYQSVSYYGGTDITNHNQLTANGLQWLSSWNENQFSKIKFNQSEVKANSDAPTTNDLAYDYGTKTQSMAIDHESKTVAGNFTGFLEHKKDMFNSAVNTYNRAIASARSQYGYGLGYQLNSYSHRFNVGTRWDDYDSFGKHSSYSLGYAFGLASAWTIGVQQGTGFKAPSLEQLYGQYGSTSLSPETNQSIEVFMQFQDGETHVRSSLFQNRIANLISANSTTFYYYNVDKVKIQGISISAQTRIEEFNFQTSIDLLNPLYDSGTNTGKQLSLRSKQVMRLAVDKQFTLTKAGLEYQFTGKRFDDAPNKVEFPAYGLVNIWTQTVLGQGWQWTNRVDNLFDVNYKQYGCTAGGVNPCNYAMPGVTFFTAMQWQFK